MAPGCWAGGGMSTYLTHLEWCRGRADAYIARNDPLNALASMLSDLRKHAETRHLADTAPMTVDPRRIQQWIEGFPSSSEVGA